MIEIIDFKDHKINYEVEYTVNGKEAYVVIDIRGLCDFVIYEGLNEGWSDTEEGGEHIQQYWEVDAVNYIEDNTEQVIKLFLESKHKPTEPSLKDLIGAIIMTDEDLKNIANRFKQLQNENN
jgi:hypothetical protein